MNAAQPLVDHVCHQCHLGYLAPDDDDGNCPECEEWGYHWRYATDSAESHQADEDVIRLLAHMSEWQEQYYNGIKRLAALDALLRERDSGK